MPFHRTMGIIGGMGPFAGSTLLERVLRTAAERHGARANDEFPRVLLASVPVEDLVSDDTAESAAVGSVCTEVSHLAAAGASVFAIACVTMHAYLPAIVDAGRGAEWVSLADLCIDEILARKSTSPLLLTSRTTARRKILSAPLEARGVKPMLLDAASEERLAKVIYALVGGAPVAHVLPMIQELQAVGLSRGADSVVLGCTELSPFATLLGALPVIDPIDAAARALCERAARAA